MQDARMLGGYVNKLLELNKMSIEDFAATLDCTTEQIELFLEGKTYLSYDKLLTLSKTLKVSITNLLDFNGAWYDEFREE